MSKVARSAPAISAHRGGGETEPSGTYEAYRSALAAGAEYVEFDVRRTLDGTLVAFHRARLGSGRGECAVAPGWTALWTAGRMWPWCTTGWHEPVCWRNAGAAGSRRWSGP